MSSSPLCKQVVQWWWYYSGHAGCILSMAMLNKSDGKQCPWKWKQQLWWWHHKCQFPKGRYGSVPSCWQWQKKPHKAASYICSKSERREFRYPHSPVQHPSRYWPQYSACVYRFVIPGGEPAIQIHHIICLVLDVSPPSARLRGLLG